MIGPITPGKPVWLECQTCGELLRKLSRDEQQDITHNPYRYIVDCRPCARINTAAGKYL